MKTKRISFALMTGALLMAASSCMNAGTNMMKSADKGDPVSKTIKIGDFSEIDVATGIDVVFTQASNPGIAKVETYSKLSERLVVKTEGKTLKVYYNNEGQNMNIGSNTTVTVSSPVLNEIEASSGGSVTISGALSSTGKIDIDVSSAGKVVIGSLTCLSLEVDGSSAGEVDIKSLKGSLDAETSSAASISIAAVEGNRLKAESSSSGSIDILSANCNYIELDASSAAGITVKGIECDTIEVDADSGATIKVEGECRVLRKNADSGGSVKSSNLKTRQ